MYHAYGGALALIAGCQGPLPRRRRGTRVIDTPSARRPTTLAVHGQHGQHGWQHGIIHLWRPAHCLSALSQRNSKTGLQVWDRRHRLSRSQVTMVPRALHASFQGSPPRALRNIGPDCRGLGQGSPSLTHSDSLARHPDGADDTRLANLHRSLEPWPMGTRRVANHIRVLLRAPQPRLVDPVALGAWVVCEWTRPGPSFCTPWV